MATRATTTIKQAARPFFASTSRKSPQHALYYDKSVVVLQKPAGIISQKNGTNTTTNGSLEHIFAETTKALGLSGEFFPVHRLDKPTTGALLVARTSASARELSRQFTQNLVGKTYLALVHHEKRINPSNPRSGEIRTGWHEDDGRVSILPLDEDVKEAVTGWEILGTSKKYPVSLLRFTIQTGRKHQIRLHASTVLNAPILGDRLFTPESHPALYLPIPDNRMFLHASQITFQRFTPKRQKVEVCAPLPGDFVQLAENIGISLDPTMISGGLFINGVQDDTHALTQLGGVWLGPQ